MRHPQALPGRGDAALGRHEVGATPHQLGREPAGNRRGRVGQVGRHRDRPRRVEAHEDLELPDGGVELLPPLLAERFRVGEVGEGQAHVEGGPDALLEPLADLLGRGPEAGHRGLGEPELLLGLGNREPRLRRLAGEGELGGAQVRGPRLQVGERGPGAGAQPAPQVGLPGEVERDPVVREDGAEHAVLGSGNGEPDEVLLALRSVQAHLELGLEVGPRDARVGQGLLEPGRRRLQVVVLPERRFHDVVEGGVAEVGPPRQGGAAAGVGAGGPRRRDVATERGMVLERGGGGAPGREQEQARQAARPAENRCPGLCRHGGGTGTWRGRKAVACPPRIIPRRRAGSSAAARHRRAAVRAGARIAGLPGEESVES